MTVVDQVKAIVGRYWARILVVDGVFIYRKRRAPRQYVVGIKDDLLLELGRELGPAATMTETQLPDRNAVEFEVETYAMSWMSYQRLLRLVDELEKDKQQDWHMELV